MSTAAAYYAEAGFFPSHRGLRDVAALNAHAAKRDALLVDALKIPRRFFAAARVGEFGPDTGENALVFAQWGARLWLAEPNQHAHPIITGYFDRFALAARLEGLTAIPFELTDGPAFDLVNAEGFIAALPTATWIAAAKRLVAPDGLFHISYFERRGMTLERITYALVRLTAALTGAAPLETAKTLLAAKWNALGASRPLASWFLDHCENPLAARAAQLATPDVVAALAAAGFRLHAAAPPSGDPLRVDWPKRRRPAAALAEDAGRHAARAALAHALGVNAYWAGSAPDALAAAVDALGEAAEAAVVKPEPQTAEALATALEALRVRVALAPDNVVAPKGLARPLEALAQLADAARGLAAGDAATARAVCAREPFLSLWGTPVHHAVFRREQP